MAEKLPSTVEEMETLVQKAAARLAIIRAYKDPVYPPLEWFINQVIEGEM
jgi:hypothetical protein